MSCDYDDGIKPNFHFKTSSSFRVAILDEIQVVNVLCRSHIIIMIINLQRSSSDKLTALGILG